MEALLTFMSTNFTSTITGAFLLACFTGYVAWRNGKKVRVANAALIYRNSIDPDKFYGLKGHLLHGALIQTFPDLKKAVHEFRLHLGVAGKISLNRAWKEYHGGEEEYPDFFKTYCIPDHGPSLLKQRLEYLRKAGEIT
jgi:hypothetical protein